MKKQFLSLALIMACAVFGMRALAAGGADRSLVSIGYLEHTFLPSLTEQIQTRVTAGMQPVYDAAQERLDRLGGEHLSNPSTDGLVWSCSDTAQVHSVKRGDTITLPTGSTALWTIGTAEAQAGLVDATAGSELADGGQLVSGHRYLSALEDDSVTVTVRSDAAQLLLQGRWVLTESDEQVTGFTDLIQSSDWFYDGVYYAVERGLFNGVSSTEFSPNTPMDRSMLATVLHRLAGSPQTSYGGEFIDVSDGQWFAQGVGWAVQTGVVKGLGEGRFGPTQDVTREQIATMLYRYAMDYLGMDVSQAGDLSVYSDYTQVSSWATEGMVWAVGAGIINGTDDGRLIPGSSATRAQVAIMLQRFEVWAS